MAIMNNEQYQLLKKCKEPPKFSGLICKAQECDKAMILFNGKSMDFKMENALQHEQKCLFLYSKGASS